MKDLERHHGETNRDICQPNIMTKKRDNFPDPDIPTILPDTVTKGPKTDMKMVCLIKKSIEESLHKKLSIKDVYETDMHKIYNLIVGQINDQLQEK